MATWERKRSGRGAQIVWTDLTVEDAPAVRDFYGAVVGWTFSACDMDGYEDFTMVSPESGESVAGVCHARGPNTNLPPQWLVYVQVEDVEKSARKATELGGRIRGRSEIDGLHPVLRHSRIPRGPFSLS